MKKIIVFTNELLKKLQTKEREFCNYEEISILIVTWNIVKKKNFSFFNEKKAGILTTKHL